MAAKTAKPDAPKIKIEIVRIDDLKRYANNPRRHSPEQVAQIAASMDEFGWTVPVLIDAGQRRDRRPRPAGRGRAARHDGGAGHSPRVPDGRSRRTGVPARRQPPVRAGSEWDVALLAGELRELEGVFDLQEFGFGEMELELAKVEDLEIMTGEEKSLGARSDAYIAEKQKMPKCVVYFETTEGQQIFFDWIKTQDSNVRKARRRERPDVVRS